MPVSRLLTHQGIYKITRVITKQPCKDESVVSLFFPYLNIYRSASTYWVLSTEGKKGRNYISRQACFVSRFTLPGFEWSNSRNRLVGKCSCVLFSSHNIYSALLQRIEHCFTRKSTCRLPIYIYSWVQEQGFCCLSSVF